jgi:hypothetical protein
MKSAIEKRIYWMASAAFIVFLAGAQPARADLLLTAESVTAMPGDTNDLFNVYITNTGAAAVDVEAFAFEINTTSSDITFEQATTGTTLFPYIFAGNSFTNVVLGSSIISTSSPGQTLDASDLVNAPNSFTEIDPGASFGLGLISFDVAPGAPNQVAQVTFNTSSTFTSVSDQNGNLQTLDFASGDITVSSVSSVPEPATGILLLVPLAGLLWSTRFSRQTRLKADR